ncbi:GTPase Obg [Roseimaritima multifibrata]|uniref:GTPase Obg n=1 Tax=Roseimaritima multifibrata TaxID=1930274 RepID=A0A517MJ76_9BACT|nr:GTPase ObgE [Roseimaritima multifibrata]QDS94904.1 GTPase Obg [Roseimaritima multifibrata]
MFVDRVEIEVHAGKGGDGCASFRREIYIPKGGPDGGNGGHGGSITLTAVAGVNSLSAFQGRYYWRAPKGMPGQGADCHGRRGKDMPLQVPPGTAVIDAEHGFVIKDLIEPGDSIVIARGGKGGYGNTHFKSSTNQAPRQFQRGELGESRKVILELKSIADVGLVGKPNAGKSTLLSRLSKARPEIADYPFTTKHPNLGMVRANAERSFVLADIPGLIDGASEGVGLGHEFLRHVERAGILLHLVEPEPNDQTDPLQNYISIRGELDAYSEDLAGRPEIVAVTKAELPSSQEAQVALQEHLGHPVYRISAVTGEGLNELLRTVTKALDEARPEGTPSLLLSETDRPQEPDEPAPEKPRRVPPHLAGPTAQLCDDLQAKDVPGEGTK